MDSWKEFSARIREDNLLKESRKYRGEISKVFSSHSKNPPKRDLDPGMVVIYKNLYEAALSYGRIFKVIIPKSGEILCVRLDKGRGPIPIKQISLYSFEEKCDIYTPYSGQRLRPILIVMLALDGRIFVHKKDKPIDLIYDSYQWYFETDKSLIVDQEFLTYKNLVYYVFSSDYKYALTDFYGNIYHPPENKQHSYNPFCLLLAL